MEGPESCTTQQKNILNELDHYSIRKYTVYTEKHLYQGFHLCFQQAGKVD